MIHKSRYWKKQLIEIAERLRSLKTVDPEEIAGDDDRFSQIGLDIFIGFYSVRKLFDVVMLVTDATKSLTFSISWYPNLQPVTWINNHRVDELYDFDTARQETRNVQFISGRIIHSFVFMPYAEEQGLAGILFASDIDKNKRLYAMKIDDVITLFERVGNDNPTDIHWSVTPTGEELTEVR
jgi:hypothetical protein